MRIVLELVIAAAIIALAWEKSLHERASDLPWIGDKITPAARTPETSAPKPFNRSPQSSRAIIAIIDAKLNK